MKTDSFFYRPESALIKTLLVPPYLALMNIQVE